MPEDKLKDLHDVKDGPNHDDPDNTSENLEIENNALKELLKENKATMDALKAELKETKTVNAKLLTKLDVSQEKPSLEEMLHTNFNKYNRKD